MLMRKLVRKQAFASKMVVTDMLRSYAAAFHHLGSPATTSKDFAKQSGRGGDDASARCSGSNQRHPPSVS
jgi:hypothetical protein